MFLRGAEPAVDADVDGKGRETLGERDEVLLREQCRRDEDRDLLSVHDCFERSAYGDLRLAVTDIAADDAVHRYRHFHVGLDLVDRLLLVRRLDVRERVFELALPRGVRAEGMSRARHPRGVEPDESSGDLAHCFARPSLAL